MIKATRILISILVGMIMALFIIYMLYFENELLFDFLFWFVMVLTALLIIIGFAYLVYGILKVFD